MSDTGALAATAIAGRVTTLDLEETEIAKVEILSDLDYGNVSVNPDNSLAVVLTGTTQMSQLEFTVQVTHLDATVEVKTITLDVVEGTQQGGWGGGDFYMLQTDAHDRITVEHGENHRKVYVSGGPDALSLADIAAIEGVSVDQVNRKFFVAHPEYGTTPDMAVAEDAASFLWNEVSGREAGPTSNWLLFERGYTYSSLSLNPNTIAGESELHPVYIGAYGSGEAPIIDADTRIISQGTKNVVIQDLHFTGGFTAMQGENILFDNVTVTDDVFNMQNIQSLTLRNSSILDVARDEPVDDSGIWAPHANRISGLFLKNSTGVLLENSLYDHSGWADGYREDLSASGSQPPSKYSHNLYLQDDNLDVTVRDNIIMRAAGDGLQLRSGGFIEDNLILDNNGGGFFGKGGAEAAGNYTLFTSNVVTSAGHRNADDGISVLSGGWRSQGNLPTLLDNIIAHLADPNNPDELAQKTVTHWGLANAEGTGPLFDNTIVYNWEGAKAAEGLNDRNLGSLDTSVLDQTTIQLFAAQLLGKTDATIADLADYLRAQAAGQLDKVVDADLIIAFFREGFGLETDLRAEAATLRFIPNELGDGVRWDNRLNWSTGDLPGTQDGDSVDLGGNLVYYGGTTVLSALDFSDKSILNVTHGFISITDMVSVGSKGAWLNIDSAGQVWFNGYSDLDILRIDAAGGRFANTGIALGNIQMDISDNAQVILATDGAEYIMRARSNLTVTGSDARVGFDGVAGGTAALLLTEGADLKFVAEGGKIGTIEEFYSGKYEQSGSGVRSGVNLGGATLEVDVSDVAALGQGSFELIHVDELIGTFGTINIVGLASNQAAKVVINYTTDKVMLHLGALGSGKGVATLQTVGEASDAKADAGLYAVLTNGHGVYPVDRPDGGISDTLDGSKNNDTLKGSMGNSEIKGFAGNDTLHGRAGNDTINGGAGEDELYGNRGADMLFGDGDNDTLFGGAGRDQLFGGKGDDMLWGGRGNDVLIGGGGKDVFGFGENFGRDRITDFQIGMDKIYLDYVGASFENLTFRTRGADTVIQSWHGAIVLEGIAVGDLSVSDFVF